MANQHSMDLRKRAAVAVEIGALSCHQAAAQFGIGVSTRRLSGGCACVRPAAVALARDGRAQAGAISGEHRSWLLERTKAKDFALRGLVAELAGSGLKVDDRAVWNRAEKPSLKKRGASERDRLDVAHHRGAVAQVSRLHRAEASGLHRRDPTRTVIVDNLGSHNAKAVRHLIRIAGAFASLGVKIFYPPKSSPELNPIEQIFAKPKALVAQGRCTLSRDDVRRNFSSLRCIYPRRMRKLFPKFSGYA